MAATEQGWNDFSGIVGLVDQLRKEIKKLGQNIGRLKAMKVEILEDPERKVEFKKVLEQHFDDTTNTTTKLKNACVKLETLLTYLEENNYIQIEENNDL
jgi:t-SNARE complex subunit (syntaxin)